MKILFLHQNFPAQFRNHIHISQRNGDHISFLCLTHYGRYIPGVNRIAIKSKLPISSSKKTEYDRMIDCGNAYYNAFLNLNSKNYTPDVVVCHNGWGCGLRLRDVWPEVFIISYHEWWFSSKFLDTPKFLCKTSWMKDSFVNLSGSYKRNSLMALEMCHADLILSPTKWQRLTLPKLLRDTCHLCFDGVDTNYFKPLNFSYPAMPSVDNRLVLTYGTRGMEPIRGFPDFVILCKQLLQDDINLTIKIAGHDEVKYFQSLPPHSSSWGEWAKKELEPWLNDGKVQFVGVLDTKSYRSFLQNSDIHFYLSVDYVPSWSFFDALACGCSVVCWDTLSIRSIIHNLNCLNLSKANDATALKDTVELLLQDRCLRAHKSELARLEALRFSLDETSKKWSDLLHIESVRNFS